jgi:glycosyltransferase involved in cell wall biosynthesis
MKVAVVQRFLPHYRVGFFTTLYRLLAQRGGDMRLFFSETMGRVESVPAWATRVRGVRKDVQLGELEESAMFAPTMVCHLARYTPDVVVLEDLSGLPNSLAGAAYCRLRRVPYLVWGLGQVPHKARSRLRRWLAPGIRFLYGGAAGFVAYSAYASGIYARYGKPIHVAPNSYLPRPTCEDIDLLARELARRAGNARTKVVVIGTLKRQKRTDVLLEALAHADASLELHIIGDGPERPRLEVIARRLGVAERVRFHGAIYDRAEKAALLASAHLGVVPGRGGLAIQELLAHGIPVISGVADGTERDMIRDGVNGYLFDGFPTAADIANRLDRFVRLAAPQRAAMYEAALDVVVQQSNIEVMAAAMLRAAEQAATGAARA